MLLNQGTAPFPFVAAEPELGEAMESPMKTLKGFTISRRCDSCGTRCTVAHDEGDKCILRCLQCGKEYSFRFKAN